jgi:hypothetical protein
MEEKLADDCAITRQITLEAANVLKTLVPDVFCDALLRFYRARSRKYLFRAKPLEQEILSFALLGALAVVVFGSLKLFGRHGYSKDHRPDLAQMIVGWPSMSRACRAWPVS